MSARRVAIAVAIIAALGFTCSACIGGKTTSPSSSGTSSQSGRSSGKAPGTNAVSRAEATVGAIKISASAPKRVAASGKPLTVTLKAENRSYYRRHLTFSSSQKFDIRVEDTQGRMIWRWSDGKFFTQAIETVTLAHGKSVSYEGQWPLQDSAGRQVGPGIYRVFSKIMAQDVKDKELQIDVTVQ